MTIISENGFPHDIEFQSHRKAVWMEGYLAVPPELETSVFDSGGYCDLVVENGVLTSIILKEKPVPPDPPPTEMEQLRADVDFLAAIGGVEL